MAEPFPWERLAGALYLAGAMAMFIATAVSVGRVLRVVRSGRRERLEDGTVLVRVPQTVTPFSWWRYIVISEADNAGCGAEIITHERAHLRFASFVGFVGDRLGGVPAMVQSGDVVVAARVAGHP